MATTVDKAFSEFMNDTVNLDPSVTQNARASKDNLLANISEFDDIDGFFDLYDSINIHFGSFARKTKCRELDDIDLMIGIVANGATYFSKSWDNVTITANKTNQSHIDCTDDNGYLNSTKVINRFKKKLESVREYSRSEVKRSGEAVVLNLLSKDWSFDIVPCFHTTKDDNGRSYYLIPNGSGGWKKTDPTLDQEGIQRINQILNGRVLDLIRLVKRWNRTKNAHTIPSYLLETLVLNYCETQTELSAFIDIRFKNVIIYISIYINNSVYDRKNIQGDINNLSDSERRILCQKAYDDYIKACDAVNLETQEKDHKKSISKWSEIFGKEFPAYG